MSTKNVKKRGFTIVELIMVIALLVVIGGIFSINMINSFNKNKKDEKEVTINTIKSAADSYVTVNPERVSKLYDGYGYVILTVGELRDAGLLKEELKDAETGEKIPDEETIRVQFQTGELLEVIYPVTTELENIRGWSLIAQDINEIASETTDNWCDNEDNLYRGLFDGNKQTYSAITSKLYLVRDIQDETEGEIYGISKYSYFQDPVNLKKTECNVNINRAGTYQIVYTYNDPELNTEKTTTRNVHVNASLKDIVSLKKVVINNNNVIIRYTESVPIYIEGTYKNGETFKIDANIVYKDGKYTILGYEDLFKISDFTTQEIISTKAKIDIIKLNSDGSYPEPRQANYTVIKNIFDITFNPNQGNVSQTMKKVVWGTSYGDLPNPTRVGYTFNGWFTEINTGIQVLATTIFAGFSDQTLYAHWTPNVYKVNFNANGGTTNTTSKNVTYDAIYGTLPTPTRVGYTFAGWFTAASGGTLISSNTKVQITSQQTLYAHWTPNVYRVSFNANGGSVSQTSKNVTYDSTYGALPTPTRVGYTFNGWYLSANGGAKIESSTKVIITYNITLYAHWTANTYQVNFNANGGSVSPSSKTLTYNSSYGTLPTPIRTGYNFNGWYTSSSGGTKITNTSQVNITSAQTLYAHWTASTYIVTFNTNGGYTSTKNKNVTYNSYYYSLPSPTKSGYKFDGWYTSPSGGTQVSYYTRVTTPSNHTLYAHWTEMVLQNVIKDLDFIPDPSDRSISYLTCNQSYNYVKYKGYRYRIYAKVNNDVRLIYANRDEPDGVYGITNPTCGSCCNNTKPVYLELGYSGNGRGFSEETIESKMNTFKNEKKISSYTVSFTTRGENTGSSYTSTMSLLTVKDYKNITKNYSCKSNNYIIDDSYWSTFWLFDSIGNNGGSWNPNIRNQAVLTYSSSSFKTYSGATAQTGDVVGLYYDDGYGWINMGVTDISSTWSSTYFRWMYSGIRPTIQLRNAKVSGGRGTYSDPYIIE